MGEGQAGGGRRGGGGGGGGMKGKEGYKEGGRNNGRNRLQTSRPLCTRRGGMPISCREDVCAVPPTKTINFGLTGGPRTQAPSLTTAQRDPYKSRAESVRRYTCVNTDDYHRTALLVNIDVTVNQFFPNFSPFYDS